MFILHVFNKLIAARRGVLPMMTYTGRLRPKGEGFN